MKSMLALVAVAAVTLAGCAETPTGAFEATREGLSTAVVGEFMVTFQPAASDLDDALQGVPGGVEDASGGAIPARCVLDPVFSGTGGALLEPCQDAYTTVSAHIHQLPLPGSVDYVAWFVGTDNATLSIGALVAQDEGDGTIAMFDLPEVSFDEDLSGMYNAIEVRRGDFVVATAPSGGGNMQALPEATANEVTATWSGADLDLTVTGLATGHDAVGWLVSVDESGAKSHDVPFSVHEGVQLITLDAGTVGDYQEFHIHVGDSKINTAIAVIE